MMIIIYNFIFLEIPISPTMKKPFVSSVLNSTAIELSWNETTSNCYDLEQNFFVSSKCTTAPTIVHLGKQNRIHIFRVRANMAQGIVGKWSPPLCFISTTPPPMIFDHYEMAEVSETLQLVVTLFFQVHYQDIGRECLRFPIEAIEISIGSKTIACYFNRSLSTTMLNISFVLNLSEINDHNLLQGNARPINSIGFGRDTTWEVPLMETSGIYGCRYIIIMI